MSSTENTRISLAGTCKIFGIQVVEVTKRNWDAVVTQGRGPVFCHFTKFSKYSKWKSDPAFHYTWTWLGEQQLYFGCNSQRAGQTHQKCPTHLYLLYLLWEVSYGFFLSPMLHRFLPSHWENIETNQESCTSCLQTF